MKHAKISYSIVSLGDYASCVSMKFENGFD